jgi:hypothetical protein
LHGSQSFGSVVYFEPAREYLSGGFEAAELLFPEVRRLFFFFLPPLVAREIRARAKGSSSSPAALSPGRKGGARHPLAFRMGAPSDRAWFGLVVFQCTGCFTDQLKGRRLLGRTQTYPV